MDNKECYDMKNITYILIFIITVTSLSGCMTERKWIRNHPTPIITKNVIVYKDSIIKVNIYDTLRIKSDTVFGDTTINIINGIVNSPTITKTTDFAIAKARVLNNKLQLNLIQRDSVISKLLKNNIKIVTKTEHSTVTRIKKVYVTRWYDHISRIISAIVVGILLFILIFKIFKLGIKL